MNPEILNLDEEESLFELTFNSEDISLDLAEIEYSLGYDSGAIPDTFINFINELTPQVLNLCEIRIGYKVIKLAINNIKKKGLKINDVYLNTDKIVARNLNKSEMILVFVSTLGYGIEKWIDQITAAGDRMKSYFVNTIASNVVENATELFHDYVVHKMKLDGYFVTNRYSPGYCNWNVAEQKILFSLLPPNFCGVSLNNSAMMQPVKSISGIIGIGKKVKYSDYMCNVCTSNDCTYRFYRNR